MNLKLYIPIAIMVIIPWAWVLSYFNNMVVQFIGLGIQLIGLALMVGLRKKIWNY